jgi:hypothetical protein
MSGAPDREQRDESAGLYVGWDELHRRVAQNSAAIASGR